MRAAGSHNNALLFQFLADRMPGLRTSDLPVPVPLPHADPYLLASAVQKSIRRGDLAMARRAGHQLYTIDRQRLWRRLAVTTLEDIGIADVTVVAEMVAISTLPATRRLLGGDLPALDIALAQACSAAKDRSGDHLASILGREPVDPEDRAALRHASPNALLAMLASSDLPWTRRLRAAVIASGRSDFVQSGDIAAVFDVLHELGAPCQLLVACEAYAARQRDGLPVLVPFAAALSRTRSPEVVTHNLPSAEYIGAWPSWVFDPLWTRIGKRAIELWLRSYLMKQPWLPRQVAAALWNAESAACDRTLDWSMSDAIRERAYRADLLARGVPRARHEELMGWIARERPALTAARRAAFESAVRQPPRPEKALEQTNLPLPVPEGWPRRG
jgi:hypothetical protein